MRIHILFLLTLVTFSLLHTIAAQAALAPWLLKDINTNTQTGLPNGGPWPVMDGVAYFSALDEHGTELWRSDGSAEGTWLVKDILPGIESSAPGYFAVWHHELWFTARVESNRRFQFLFLILDLDLSLSGLLPLSA